MSALMLPVLLAAAALVVDVGNVFAQRRTLQQSADAAALAAAQDIKVPSCTPNCLQTLAVRYSTMNGGPGSLSRCASAGATNCWVYPYVSDSGVVDPTKLEVRLRREVNTIFAGLLGASKVGVNARAVASTAFATSVTPGTTTVHTVTGTSTSYSTSTSTSTVTTTIETSSNVAAFAMSTDPHALNISGGSAAKVFSSLVTNGCIDVSGLSNDVSKASYLALGRKGDKGCKWSGHESTFAPSDPSMYVGPFAPLPWPADPVSRMNSVLAACGGNIRSSFDESAMRAAGPGTYCFSVALAFNGTPYNWNGYTFLTTSTANSAISVVSDGQVFTAPAPAARNIAFFVASGLRQDGTCSQIGPSFFSNHPVDITGQIYAPCGDVTLNAGNQIFSGFLEAQRIIISGGKDTTFQGTGPGGTSTTESTVTTTTTTPVITPVTSTWTDTNPAVTRTTGTNVSLSQ